MCCWVMYRIRIIFINSSQVRHNTIKMSDDKAARLLRFMELILQEELDPVK